MSRKYPYESNPRNYEFDYGEEHTSYKRDEFGLYYKKTRSRNGKTKVRKYLSLLEGSFKVKYDDGSIETFVINDNKDADRTKNEIASDSPLAQGAHKHKVGEEFEIPDGKVKLLEKDLDWKDYPHDKKYDAYKNVKWSNDKDSDSFKDEKVEIIEENTSYSLTGDKIIQDDLETVERRKRRREAFEKWRSELKPSINTSTYEDNSSNVEEDDDWKKDLELNDNEDGQYRKTKDQIIQDEIVKPRRVNTKTSSVKTAKQSEVSNDQHSNNNDKNKVVNLIVMLIIVGLLLLLVVTKCSKKDENKTEVNKTTMTSTTTTTQTETTTKNNKKDSNKEKTTTKKSSNNSTSKTTVTTSNNTTTPTTTKKGDKLVRFYDGDSKQYKDYWLNVGDEFTLPTNNYNKQKTSNIEYRVYKDPLRYNDYNTYYSYTVYKKNGWVDSNGKKYKNGEKIIITDNLLYFKANYDKEIECAHVPTPTKEGYKFLGWSFVSGYSPRLDFEFCGSANEIMKVYGNWEEL